MVSVVPRTVTVRLAEESSNRKEPSDVGTILRYIGRRILSAVLTLFLISVLVFFAVSFLGGDSASVLLGRDATPEMLASAQHKLGLDRPLHERYVTWLFAFVQGDFGATSASILEGTPIAVNELIAEPLLNSAILAILTFVLTAVIAIWLGQRAGFRPGSKTDRTISSVIMGFASLPEFVTATLLIFIFFYTFDLLSPVSLVPAGLSPLQRPEILVLPVLSLTLGLLAVTARQVRAAVIDVSRLPYVQAARLNGYPERTVRRSFVTRNSMAPTVQVLALVFIYLFGGVIVIEQVFAYPGIGNLLIRAVTSREVVILQAITMIVAVISIGLSLIADILVLFLVPKLRTSR